MNKEVIKAWAKEYEESHLFVGIEYNEIMDLVIREDDAYLAEGEVIIIID